MFDNDKKGKNDSQNDGLASITASYTDSENEDDHRDVSGDEQSNTPDLPAVSNSPIGSRTNSSASASPIVYSRPSFNDPKEKRQLVSYHDDTVVSDDEGNAQTTEESNYPTNGMVYSEKMEVQEEVKENDDNEDMYDVKIPPEPSAPCPPDVQEKIRNFMKKMENQGLDMNKAIQQRKDFRNPSIYEKLISFCDIDELGTNYPKEGFNPKWGEGSFYEELAKAQKAEMDKLEKARKEKTKVEIVSGTAKRAIAPTTAEDDAKKRKSKWDQINTNPGAASMKTNIMLTQNLTSSNVLGTGSTLVSAFGSLPKKRL